MPEHPGTVNRFFSSLVHFFPRLWIYYGFLAPEGAGRDSEASAGSMRTQQSAPAPLRFEAPMRAANTQFTHVVLWMSARAWPLQSQIVAADRVERDTERLTLLREGRPVFQARIGDIAHFEHYPSLHAAKRAFDERRATRGRGGLRVEELAPSSGGSTAATTVARGGPAEGIGFRISEDR